MKQLNNDASDSKSDKTQVGLSIDANDNLAHLTDVFQWFKDGSEAYKVAVAVALARSMKESDLVDPKPRKTKYGVGSLDESGKMRDMISTLRPELADRPYAHSEWLAEIGLSILRVELEQGRLLYEVLTNKDMN